VEEQKINGRLVNNFKFWNHLESKKGGGRQKKKKGKKHASLPTDKQTIKTLESCLWNVRGTYESILFFI
jgi:hypothetical protein